ncbi:SDR family oxidoreductase [Gordonia sp. CPCC 205333]|uniref:SDR family oxidoreductase n=1 Tax=Gordonia sp. CPCC 205333 TaxID=3140790 RepID=UPI003AF3717F
MDLGLSRRVAVVCGSSSGIGEAVARTLAAEGARVIVTGRRGRLIRRIAGELPDAAGVEADLLADGGPARLIEATAEIFGAPDILVLNGPGPRPDQAHRLAPTDISEAIRTAMLPHLELISRALPIMRERKWGRIIAISSTGTIIPIPNLAPSNIARNTLASYLMTLAAEVAADGITVNQVAPGRIHTARSADLDTMLAELTDRSVEEIREAASQGIPVGRYGTPQEVADLTAFLCSTSASYLTATTIACDGGAIGRQQLHIPKNP